MKKIYSILFILFGISIAQAQNNVGIGTNTPNASAKLDITATDKGLLIPRVNLSGTGDATTIAGPATGLMVFNQTAAGSGATAVAANTFYYYNGTKWVKLEASLGDDWIKATTATTPAIYTDDQYVKGSVGIGDFSSTSPANKLHVINNADGAGVAALDNSTAGGFAGMYFYQGGSSNYRGHIGYVNTGGASSFGGKGTFQLASGNRPMLFSVGSSGSELFLERMRIDQNGNVGIGLSSIPTESRLALGAMDASNEGGQLQLNAPGGTYTTAHFIDNYQNNLRFMSGTNTGSSATRMSIDNNGAVTVNNLAGTGNRRVFANANGVLNVSSTNVLVSSAYAAGTSGSNTTKTVISSGSTMNVDVGDVIIIDANVTLRLTGGSNTDDFYIKPIKTGTSTCTCTDGSSTPRYMLYRPDEGGSDHDNYRPIHYLDYCTVTGAGTLIMRLDVQNTGNDGWEHSQAVMVVRKE